MLLDRACRTRTQGVNVGDGHAVPAYSRVMPPVTIISDDARSVEATIADDRILLDVDALPAALGWTLKPEGLCRDDTCSPLRDREALFVDGQLDVAAVAAALGRASVVDAPAGIAAVGLDDEQRRGALQMLVAPPFTLPDLDGIPHELSQWRGQKRLLHAFSSW
jgi:hypothetical protein